LLVGDLGFFYVWS